MTKNAAAVALGKRRMRLLTPEEREALLAKASKGRLKIPKRRRQAIAKKAAEARWGKK